MIDRLTSPTRNIGWCRVAMRPSMFQRFTCQFAHKLYVNHPRITRLRRSPLAPSDVALGQT
jgi:hypothetical protein